MKRVMAQGCFDVIHPGHLHYLEKSADLGDELVVVVARDSRVGDRKKLAFNEDERVEILNALETVDRAVLGSEGDIYSTVKEIDPNVITVGYDQSHETEEVQKLAEDATEHDVKVKRISGKGDYSSSKIKN
ncbi:adenylyltransferase/cytidyltransferase family protein [Candidatus Nanohalococcus occultus]|uniref:FAD synthetase n=1 Tax=Candidatus Nanohalococcus occultus TaxID=2978047 RepID=A0ABY8CDK8_9ARCH|nr:FAD synthetase [Candidatus Nanohaloarchaeota archaeon SVXNc]